MKKNKNRYVYYVIITNDRKNSHSAKKAITSCIKKIKKISKLSRQELVYQKGRIHSLQYVHNFIVVTKKSIEHAVVWKEMAKMKNVNHVDIKFVDNNDRQK